MKDSSCFIWCFERPQEKNLNTFVVITSDYGVVHL